MDEQRTRARRARAAAGRRPRSASGRPRFRDRRAFETDFVGYERTDATTTIGAVGRSDDGELFVKLHESPFYATGGGQVADAGVVECEGGGCRARVTDVIRLGQTRSSRSRPSTARSSRASASTPTSIAPPATRPPATTATHLLHAALRRHLGDHVRQAGSYSVPTSSGSTSPTAARCRLPSCGRSRTTSTAGSSRAIRCGRCRRRSTRPGRSARWRCSTRSTATSCGWSRWGTGPSRASCAAARTSASTSEIGLFRSSTRPPAPPTCAGSRRSPALRRSRSSASVTVSCTRPPRELRVPPERVTETVRGLREQLRELDAPPRLRANGATGAVDVDELIARAGDTGGAKVLRPLFRLPTATRCWRSPIASRPARRRRDVLGRAGDGRVDLVASVAPSLVQRGVRRRDHQAGGRGGRRRRWRP